MSYQTCTDCIDYMEARHAVIVPALAERREETGETAQQILDRYMGGVHDRLLAGFPILSGGAA
jgi:hypothetical protein